MLDARHGASAIPNHARCVETRCSASQAEVQNLMPSISSNSSTFKMRCKQCLQLVLISFLYIYKMQQYTEELKSLFNRIPRRHSLENIKEINSITNDYEDILRKIEAINDNYEKGTASLFSGLDIIRAKIKMSTDNKASKKNKDVFFDEASGTLKDNIQSLLDLLI